MQYYFTRMIDCIKVRSIAGTLSLAVVLFVISVSSGFGQRTAAVDSIQKQANPVTLTQAIQISLANNSQIQQALLSIKNADQQVRTAWSEVLPEVTASANYTRNLEVPVNFIPEIVFNPEGDPNNLVPVAFGTDNNWSGGVTVSQTIFNGRAFIGVNTSQLFKTAQAESLRATAQQVVTQTRLAYYNVLVAQERVRLQQAQIDRIQENLEDARARLEQGFVDEYAVLQLEVQLSNLQPQLTQAQYAVDDALRNLLDVMGLPVELPLDIQGDLNNYEIRSQTTSEAANASLKEVDTMTPLNLQADSTAINKVAEYRGDLRILDVQQQLQEKQVKAQQSQYLPSLTASYNLQYSAAQPGRPVFFGTEEQRARSQTFLLNLRLPIFQGFSRDAAIQQAKIQMRQLELQEFQTKQNARKEIVNAEENIRAVYETATARQKAIEQAQRGYERALLRYQNGLGSQQEVTDAQLQLRQAELNYAQMVFNYLAAKARYDLAVGMVPFVDQQPQQVREDITTQ